ncbi:MAG: Kef-type K+ transport system membrane component KefB [Paraglaciecola sp.]|jgi:Kef-type K+ transport system membrane component KefB
MHFELNDTAEFLLAIGGILLLGMSCDFIGKKTSLPRVTLLLLFGVLIGQQMLDLIPESLTRNFEIVTNMALLVVGFLLGGKFDLKKLKKDGRGLLWISAAEALFTTLLVTIGLWLLSLPLPVAFLLGCIATASSPIPILDVIVELKTHSRFSELVLKVVAIDDVWALILFSMGIALMSVFHGNGEGVSSILLATYQICGAVLLGLALGVPGAQLTGRIKSGEPTLVEALGLVFVCGGLALYLDVSYLIAVMVMGAVIANTAKHHDYPFHEIENIEWPFMLVFFVLAGASLELVALKQITFIGLIYIFCRTLGKYAGAWLGAKISGIEVGSRNWIGLALLPQAGVEIGMVLLAALQFPEYRQLFLPLVISGTIIFELIGPPLTRYAIKKVPDRQ